MSGGGFEWKCVWCLFLRVVIPAVVVCQVCQTCIFHYTLYNYTYISTVNSQKTGMTYLTNKRRIIIYRKIRGLMNTLPPHSTPDNTPDNTPDKYRWRPHCWRHDPPRRVLRPALNFELYFSDSSANRNFDCFDKNFIDWLDSTVRCGHVNDKEKGVLKWNTLGGEQDVTVINESGLYSLLLSFENAEHYRQNHWL